MQHPTQKILIIVSSLATVATVALAQPRNAAAGAAGAAQVPAVRSVLPPTVAAPATTRSTLAATSAVNAAPRASSAATATARAATAATPAANLAPALSAPAAVTASTAVTAGAANRGGNPPAGVTRGVNAEATTHASATGQTRGLAVAQLASGQTAVTTNLPETVRAIHEASFETRGQLTADLETRLDATTRQLVELRAKADQGGEKSRAEFAHALVEVRQQEKELRASLRAAMKVSDEKAWGEAQSALAKEYGAFAKAVAHAEVVAQPGAEPPKS